MASASFLRSASASDIAQAGMMVSIFSDIRPFGCLNANPLMAGTGGTLPAGVNAVAGSVLADGYKAVGSGLTGITTRWFKEPAPMVRRSASSCVATWRLRGATSTCNPRPTWYRPIWRPATLLKWCRRRKSWGRRAAFWLGRLN
ncbi:hypothetical protein ALP05_04918 [Pseudomonas caricapapayae]|uniref:Uncharacterized protein n=1 Tax=Pseudomonas caricapapayae TaxID=46678 RepID=A0A3M6FDI9_9PSED|nr:hypothetical protein ALP05_04918 [Pseudomonas caricapapayae]